MLYLKSQILNKRAGFTLIELLIVITVIAIISTVTVASFVSYSKKSSLKQASLDVSSLLRDAKYRTQAQIKPSACTGTLQGYRVDVCGLTGSSCATADTYTLSLICSGGNSTLITKKLPSNIHFTNTGTTSVSYFFKVLTNGVTGSGVTALTGFGTDSGTVTVGAGGTLMVR